MSYRSYDYFTRKQCNVIFKAIKRGDITSPKGGNGRRLKDGFVYRYEGQGFYAGMNVSKSESLFNCQLAALQEIVSRLCAGDKEGAQRIIDVDDEWFRYWCGKDYDVRKFWRQS